jgi:hypothetical protein
LEKFEYWIKTLTFYTRIATKVPTIKIQRYLNSWKEWQKSLSCQKHTILRVDLAGQIAILRVHLVGQSTGLKFK